MRNFKFLAEVPLLVLADTLKESKQKVQLHCEIIKTNASSDRYIFTYISVDNFRKRTLRISNFDFETLF